MPSSSDKYIGMALAVLASVGIGASSIVAKIGLNDAAKRSASSNGRASDGFGYLTNGIWWAGSGLMVIGEVANFAAYTYAPPILVTPLGALSVIFAAILASIILNEHLGHLGRVGVALCMLGSIIIVLHAPQDKDISTVDEIMTYALNPGFVFYALFVLVYTVFMMYRVAPTHGPRNPLVWISMCSFVGSISIMCIKGFGIALRLTLEGHNQFGSLATYVMAGIAVGCLLMQMYYYTKVLDTFSTNVVNPIYYVMFSTSTIVASLLLFQGFNTADGSAIASLLSGFIVTFLGVHLLNWAAAAEKAGNSPDQMNAVSHHARNGRSRQGQTSADRVPLRLDTDSDEFGQDIEIGGGMHGAFMRSAGAETPTSASWRTGTHVAHLPLGRNGRTGNGHGHGHGGSGVVSPTNVHGDGELYRAHSSALVSAFEVEDGTAGSGSAHGSGDEARLAKRRSLEPRG